MSVWTHVAGSIRFDAIRLPGMPDQNPAGWIGPRNLWDEDNEESTIPAGSEGSLDYRVIENEDQYHIAAYTVVIFGDLRDFSDVDTIKEWLESITADRLVRQGVVQCEVEYGERVIFNYRDEHWHAVTIDVAA